MQTQSSSFNLSHLLRISCATALVLILGACGSNGSDGGNGGSGSGSGAGGSGSGTGGSGSGGGSSTPDIKFFAANDGVNGYELWKSDGTAAGTMLVKDILPGTGNSNIYIHRFYRDACNR